MELCAGFFRSSLAYKLERLSMEKLKLKHFDGVFLEHLILWNLKNHGVCKNKFYVLVMI